MSTFDGHVKEFPDIRIDRFRHEPGSRPALAYFLSHVHTDHLVGLDANRGIFVYCSGATREILLKLEKYPHRMNFAKGILESRKRTYRDLDRLLRPIPLETPTEIQLGFNRTIRVTLFDANHCTGSTMFFIEGDGKAVLYTGDVRSELWWVNSLLRNPILIPYVASTDQPSLKRLDNVYLDTTFANKSDPYQEFPSKASGLMELLRQVSKYPHDTLFYFDAWTFGYEEVWQSLSAHLGTQIHVDKYRYRVYQSLLQSKEAPCADATKLNGACIGNDERRGGCLTTQQCRLHSCEKGTGCEIWNKQFVRLTPIISRHNGVDMAELGAGGGHRDLNQQHELDLSDPAACTRLMQLCYSELKDQAQLRDGVFDILNAAMESYPPVIRLELADLATDSARATKDEDDADDLSLVQTVRALAEHVTRLKRTTNLGNANTPAHGLPKQITFPYSRHSSYTELCLLIAAFKPRDITPCTVDEQNWTADRSMVHLFGHVYTEPILFAHDQAMFARLAQNEDGDEPLETQYDQPSQTPPRETQISETRAEDSSPHNAIDRRQPSQDDMDDERRSRSSKRRRVSHEGDYWPPQERDHYSPPVKSDRNVLIDHYSPPRRRESRRSRSPTKVSTSTERALGKVNEQPSVTENSWSQPTVVEDRLSSPSRQINRWQKRIAQSRQQTETERTSANASRSRRSSSHAQGSDNEDVSCTTQTGKPSDRSGWSPQPSRRRQSIDHTYGRLFPPPAMTPSVSEPEEDEAQEDKEWDEAELKLALQWEAHDAAMGIGQDWSAMGLVSVQNHQVKEEEL